MHDKHNYDRKKTSVQSPDTAEGDSGSMEKDIVGSVPLWFLLLAVVLLELVSIF